MATRDPLPLASYERPTSKPETPWKWLPVLYVMQALPVSIVQELMTVVYKDLGVANETILKWTAVIALPWSLQMLLGPLVDLTGTKREWVVRSQVLIAILLAIVPFVLALPFAFELSLLTLTGVAVVSALCNTATDGFYLLAIPNRDLQASFAGVQSTAYRIGTLIVGFLLIWVAGRLSEFKSVPIQSVGGSFGVLESGAPRLLDSATLRVSEGKLADADGKPLIPAIEIPSSLASLAIETDGRLVANESGHARELGRLSFFHADGAPASDGVGLARRTELVRSLPVRTAWIIALAIGAGLYAVGVGVNHGRIPAPLVDREATASPAEIRRNAARTLAIVGLYGAAYFSISALWKLVANALAGTSRDLAGWAISNPGRYLGYDVGLAGLQAELAQFVVLAPTALILLSIVRRSVGGTPMGEAFSTFFRQPRILAILGFLLFYRFGEAMVNGTAPLFLKGLPSEGGLGLSNEQLAALNGFTGIGGMIVGGIAGGWLVGRFGLRSSIWPLMVVMHLPNLIYLWASVTRPGLGAMYAVNFVDKFGYGFGFAAYFVILQRIAQRGSFKTSHYAIGVGLGAMFIQVAKILSGIIEDKFGFVGFFVGACLLTIPGMLSVLFVPMGDRPNEIEPG